MVRPRVRPSGSRRDRAARDPRETHVLCLLCRRRYQAVTYTHLKARHGIEAPADYKSEFGLERITAGAVRERVAEAHRSVWAREIEIIRKRWRTREQQAIARELGLDPATVRAWRKSLGLPELVRRWDRSKVVDGIRRARRAGLALNAAFARSHPSLRPLYSAARIHFASWRAAIRAAGLSYGRVAIRSKFERWSRARILSEIRRLSAEREQLGYRFLEEKHPKLYTAARSYFGNWKNALRACFGSSAPPDRQHGSSARPHGTKPHSASLRGNDRS